jgi:hypothetical protein
MQISARSLFNWIMIARYWILDAENEKVKGRRCGVCGKSRKAEGINRWCKVKEGARHRGGVRFEAGIF